MRTPERYENHDAEWREEDKRTRREQRYIPWVDPRDPAYVETEDEEV